jgi:hypothetical protein
MASFQNPQGITLFILVNIHTSKRPCGRHWYSQSPSHWGWGRGVLEGGALAEADIVEGEEEK